MGAPQSGRERVQPPAIALIVIGGLDLLTGLVLAVAGVTSLARDTSRSGTEVNVVRAGFLTVQIGIPLVCLAIGAAVLLGGVALLRGRSRRAGTVAAVLALVPVSCCFPAGVGVGIWALVVLTRDDVRDAFAERGEG